MTWLHSLINSRINKIICANGHLAGFIHLIWAVDGIKGHRRISSAVRSAPRCDEISQWNVLRLSWSKNQSATVDSWTKTTRILADNTQSKQNSNRSNAKHPFVDNWHSTNHISMCVRIKPTLAHISCEFACVFVLSMLRSLLLLLLFPCIANNLPFTQQCHTWHWLARKCDAICTINSVAVFSVCVLVWFSMLYVGRAIIGYSMLARNILHVRQTEIRWTNIRDGVWRRRPYEPHCSTH